MRKFLIPALVLSTVVGVAPAAANHGGYRDRDRGNVGWNRGGPSRQAINELLRDLNQAENRHRAFGRSAGSSRSARPSACAARPTRSSAGSTSPAATASAAASSPRCGSRSTGSSSACASSASDRDGRRY